MSTIGECNSDLNYMLYLIIGMIILGIIAIIYGSVTKGYGLIAIGSLCVIIHSPIAIVSIYKCKNEIL